MASNIQFLRTDRAINSAFLSLLAKKPFDKITVQNILDATPVSRATFYKHYHDKYEIAETIQSDLLRTYLDLFDALSVSGAEICPILVQQHLLRYQDTAQRIMDVRTERVNLPAALDQEARRRYLERSDSPTRELEARIYGAAVSAFLVGLLECGQKLQTEEIGSLLLPVALQLMGLPGDPDLTSLALEKYAQTKTAKRK